MIFICLYVIGHYVIQFIHILDSIRLSICVLVAIAGYPVTGVRFVTVRITARVTAFLGIFLPNLLHLLEFASQSGLLGNIKEHRILLLESLQLFLPFTCLLILLSHRFSPTYHSSSQYILDVFLFGTLSKKCLSTVRHIIFLRHS